MWGVFNLIPSANLLSKSKKRGFVGAFLAGILGGIFSSPCSTPVLIALLAIVAGNGNLLWGILLMLLPYKIAAPAGMIGASNFFELAVAVAIALFGTTSPAALATTVGVLTEVPVMLLLVRIANKTKGRFPA